MTVGELTDLLVQVDRDRNVYVPGVDGKAEIADMVIDLQHVNLPKGMEGIKITDDVAILPMSIYEATEADDDHD